MTEELFNAILDLIDEKMELDFLIRSSANEDYIQYKKSFVNDKENRCRNLLVEDKP